VDLSTFWQKSLEPFLAGQVRIYLAAGAAAAIGHGYLRPDSAGAVVEIGAGAVSLVAAAGWQVWVDYIQPILKDQLEIMKAKSHAQAAKMREAGIKPVTVTEIAAQSPTMDVAAVTKAIGTLPPAVQANIAGMTGSGVKGALAVLAILFLAWPGDASAQTRRIQPPAVTGDLKKDLNTDAQNLGIVPKSLQVTPTGNVAADLQTLWTKIVASSNVDLAYASKLAAGANTAASLVRKQCWDAIVALNEQANGLNLKNPDGTPMARPDPHLFTDVETLAEVVDNLSPQGPLFVSCAGAAQLAKTNVLTFINAAVTGAAGLAAMPIIPGL
jgi:hypothetical protein